MIFVYTDVPLKYHKWTTMCWSQMGHKTLIVFAYLVSAHA